MASHPITLEDVRKLNREDPLANFRERFVIPEGVSYFDGHSLGLLPRATAARQDQLLLREWGGMQICAWNEAGWIDLPQRVGARIARLIGAAPREVIVADSTSVNLFKLLVAAARLSDRPVLLTEAGNFHTDVYVASGAAELAGLELRVVARSEIESSIDEQTNLVLLTHVHYKTAERFDMAAMTHRARDAGARVVWDLSHSTGAVPLDVRRDGVELAVGCGYKYLNGGPGAPAFLYIAELLQDRLVSPLRGWFGHAAPFDFSDTYVPAAGIDRFLAGTPPILSLAALQSGIEVFEGVTMDQLWAKSIRLFDLFAQLMAEHCPELECISPADPQRRGSHIAFRHTHAFAICQALIAQGVIGDFRDPDVIRFGLTPLTLRYEDVWDAIERCSAILSAETWRDELYSRRQKVT